MADDEATTVTFRRNHLVRLRGLTSAALNGKLARIEIPLGDAGHRLVVTLLDDRPRPPVPAVPARQMAIKPANMRHACEYCLVAAPEGEQLQNKVVGLLLWAGATPPLFDHVDRNVPTNG